MTFGEVNPSLTAPHSKVNTWDPRVDGKEVRFIQGLTLRRWRGLQSSLLRNSGTQKGFYREGKEMVVVVVGRQCSGRLHAEWSLGPTGHTTRTDLELLGLVTNILLFCKLNIIAIYMLFVG